MASEIRANKQTNRVGLGTVTYTDTGIIVSGIVTANSFKGDGDFVELDVDGHTNLDNVSIAGVTTANGNITISNAEKYHRETYFVSVHTRNLAIPQVAVASSGQSISVGSGYNLSLIHI